MDLTVKDQNREADVIAKDFISQIEDGQVSALQAAISLKKMMKVGKTVLAHKKVKESVLDEARTYITPQIREPKLMGASFTETNVKTSYDYRSTGHPEYLQILDHISALEKRRKELERGFREMEAGQEVDITITSMPKLTYEKVNIDECIQAPNKTTVRGVKFTV